MHPTLKSGDWILVRRLDSAQWSMAQWSQVVGHIVMVEREGLLQIKRVVEVKQGEADEVLFWVEGDNKEASTDSRAYGWITSHHIIGKYWFRYKRARKVRIKKPTLFSGF